MDKKIGLFSFRKNTNRLQIICDSIELQYEVISKK